VEASQRLWVAVDLAVFTVERGRLQLLLIQMKRAPFTGRWALPGGRIGARETVEEAAERELEEKTSLTRVYLEQLYTFSSPDRDPAGRCLSVAHMALIPPGRPLAHTAKYAAIGWFPVEKLPPLAFDNAEIARYAIERLRAKLAYTNVAYSLLPERFPLAELQRAYEAILGRRLDPRNFRKRIVAMGLVEETGELKAGGAHRPARLFRFTLREPVEMPVLA
jgi:8-oxo-dGTP diphosphatase